MYDDMCNENLLVDEVCKNDVFKGIKDKMLGFMRDFFLNCIVIFWFEYFKNVIFISFIC